MKKLNSEEAAKVALAGHGRMTTVSAMVATLEVGEVVIITRTDWKITGAPFRQTFVRNNSIF